MKKIICFGDSNTYGYNPKDGSRYPKSIRWTGLLSKNLENKYTVVEAGLNDRNCFINHQGGALYVGHSAILDYLDNDISLIVFALGINDLQFKYNVNLDDFKTGLLYTLNKIKLYKKILLCPPCLTKDVLYGNFAHQFDIKSIEKSKKLSEIYKEISKKTNSDFIDLNNIVKVSPIDGLHLDPVQHRLIANCLTEKILSMENL